jgi:hypothetical protein
MVIPWFPFRGSFIADCLTTWLLPIPGGPHKKAGRQMLISVSIEADICDAFMNAFLSEFKQGFAGMTRLERKKTLVE